MAFYNINGQRIYAREEGAANNQVALLVHGWSSSWFALSPLMPLLSKRFRCIAVDLPGYGNSPPLRHRASIDAYADLLAQLVQEVTGNPIVVIGHSMGGMIGLTMALRHPVLIERMVLLGPTISGHLSTYIDLFISPITMLERFPITDRLVSGLEPYLLHVTDRLMRPASFAERSAISEADYIRLRADARRPGQGRARAECYTAMRNGDLRGRLAQVEAPSLVLWGAEDNTVPLRDAGVVADEWPAADLRIIPKAGHWPQFETPLATQRYLASFLGLPLVTARDEDETPVSQVSQIAQFLNHSDVGNGLNQAQRTRLAAHFSQHTYEPFKRIVNAQDEGSDLYIVQDGTVEVWSDPVMAKQYQRDAQCLATLLAGQITGELALLDGGRRSADLRAGPEGATVLVLKRERLLALNEDDPVLGNRVVWNIATALALRLRLMNWRHIAGQQPVGEPLQVETSPSVIRE